MRKIKSPRTGRARSNGTSGRRRFAFRVRDAGHTGSEIRTRTVRNSGHLTPAQHGRVTSAVGSQA